MGPFGKPGSEGCKLWLHVINICLDPPWTERTWVASSRGPGALRVTSAQISGSWSKSHVGNAQLGRPTAGDRRRHRPIDRGCRGQVGDRYSGSCIYNHVSCFVPHTQTGTKTPFDSGRCQSFGATHGDPFARCTGPRGRGVESGGRVGGLLVPMQPGVLWLHLVSRFAGNHNSLMREWILLGGSFPSNYSWLNIKRQSEKFDRLAIP